jgi:hypothetical protein
VSKGNAQRNGKSRAIGFYEGDKINATALRALVRTGVQRRTAGRASRTHGSS